MLENIRNALRNGECGIGIFRDFIKEFDTVDHDIFSNKLCNCGIRYISFALFNSYLYNRYQVVKYDNYESEP